MVFRELERDGVRGAGGGIVIDVINRHCHAAGGLSTGNELKTMDVTRYEWHSIEYKHNAHIYKHNKQTVVCTRMKDVKNSYEQSSSRLLVC